MSLEHIFGIKGDASASALASVKSNENDTLSIYVSYFRDRMKHISKSDLWIDNIIKDVCIEAIFNEEIEMPYKVAVEHLQRILKDEEDIYFNYMKSSDLKHKLKSIDDYAINNPGKSISDYVLKIFPEIANIGLESSDLQPTAIASSGTLPIKTPDIYKKRSDKSEPAMLWASRDQEIYPDRSSTFQFIADYHPTLRTTGGLYAIDTALYNAHRRALEDRVKLERRGDKLPALPSGYVPLIDKDTEMRTRKRQNKKTLREAWAVIAQDRRDKDRGIS